MVGVLGQGMGKLTALKIRSLAERERYAVGDGLFLDVTGKATGTSSVANTVPCQASAG